MILIFILQIAVRVPRLIAFFILISYVPYLFSIVFNNLILFLSIICSFSKASETLKIISLALEDKKWFDFCLDILSIYMVLFEILMLHDKTHEKCNKVRISCSPCDCFC